MSSITVTPNLQIKSVSSSTSAQTITPDSGYCGLRQVNISAFSGNTVQENYYTVQKSNLNYSYDSISDYNYTYGCRTEINSIFPSNRKFFITTISFIGPSGGNIFSLNNALTIQQISSSTSWNSIGQSDGVVINSSTGSNVTYGSVKILCQLSEINDILGIDLFLGFKSDLYSYFNNVQGTSSFSINTWCF